MLLFSLAIGIINFSFCLHTKIEESNILDTESCQKTPNSPLQFDDEGSEVGLGKNKRARSESNSQNNICGKLRVKLMKQK